MDAPVIATADDAAKLLRPRFDALAGERVVVLHLGAGRGLLGISEYPGTIDQADLPLRAIIGSALEHDARGMIVAHNHPSGAARPSEEDVAATALLVRTAKALEIHVYDHLIFAGGSWASFRGLGLL